MSDPAAGGAVGPLGENLVFLLGLPRSGTTLLSVMLDNHPQAVSPPEPWIMLALRQLGRVDARHPANSQVLGAAVRRFAGDDGLIRAARAAAAALYGEHLAAAGKSRFVDKTPRYLLIPEYLRRVFPRARFLWLLRDPFDVAASYRSTWGMNLPDILREGRDVPELFDLTVGLDRLERFAADNPDAVHVVRYERLVADPAETLKAALAHLDLPADDKVIAGMCALADAKRPPGGFGDPKILATTAPHANSIGAWRAAFDAAELETLLNALGGERLARLGYRDTTAALTEIGVREDDPQTGARLRAVAEQRLRDRLDDIERVCDHRDGDDVLRRIQARLHAVLNNEDPSLQPQPNSAAEDALRREIAAERAARATAEAETRRLRAVAAEQERRLAALRASTSWRITAPLRRAVNLLTGR